MIFSKIPDVQVFLYQKSWMIFSKIPDMQFFYTNNWININSIGNYLTTVLFMLWQNFVCFSFFISFFSLVSIATTTDISLPVFPLDQTFLLFGLILICLIGVAACVYFIDGKDKLLLLITSLYVKFKLPPTYANTHWT